MGNIAVEEVKPGDYVAVKVIELYFIVVLSGNECFTLLFRYMMQPLRFLKETCCTKPPFLDLYMMHSLQI